jgi:hypothetical protein
MFVVLMLIWIPVFKLQRNLTNDTSFQKSRAFKASFLMRLLLREYNFFTSFLKIQFLAEVNQYMFLQQQWLHDAGLFY